MPIDTIANIRPVPNVDILADTHELYAHLLAEKFDTDVLSAIRQYCSDPRRVVHAAAAVLKPGGTLLIDAPILQLYCPNGKDVWRFTNDGLCKLCREELEFIDLSITIGAGHELPIPSQAVGEAGEDRAGAGRWRVYRYLVLMRRRPGRAMSSKMLQWRRMAEARI